MRTEVGEIYYYYHIKHIVKSFMKSSKLIFIKTFITSIIILCMALFISPVNLIITSHLSPSKEPFFFNKKQNKTKNPNWK